MANPKPLRTISINFPFHDPSVVNVSNFSTDRALFDFEVVVVRPYSVIGSGKSGGEFSVEWRDYSRVKQEMARKIEDISRLLQGGGLLVVVLDAVQVLRCQTGGYTGGTIYTVTNYDFLHPHFFESIGNGSGDRISIDSTEPFSKVISASPVFWTAFIRRKVPYPFDEARVFATNGSDAVVGSSVEMGAGHVVFLPNFKSFDETAFFEACLDYCTRREGTPTPDWVSSIYLSGQTAVEQGISLLEKEIKTLEGRRDTELAALRKLLEYKKLLFEKGKTQLEPIVMSAMTILGFQASAGEIISGTNFEIDGRTKGGSSPGILEIKGSKNQIGLAEIGAFPTKIIADLEASKFLSKGILVGNGLCLEPPQKRLGNAVFTQHILDAAKTNSIALVNSVDLYGVVCNVLGSQIKDLNAVRQTILAANGYADLSQFIAKSPFRAK
jgi:hypothetical protein